VTRSDPLILALLASQRVLMDALALTGNPIIEARIREHGKEIARTISMQVKAGGAQRMAVVS
jgi:hypothetical protein